MTVCALQVNGVKGCCVLSLHKPFNLVKGIVIDSMHTVFLRVVLSLTVLWFGNKTRNEDYSIRKMVYLCIPTYICITNIFLM